MSFSNKLSSSHVDDKQQSPGVGSSVTTGDRAVTMTMLVLVRIEIASSHTHTSVIHFEIAVNRVATPCIVIAFISVLYIFFCVLRFFFFFLLSTFCIIRSTNAVLCVCVAKVEQTFSNERAPLMGIWERERERIFVQCFVSMGLTRSIRLSMTWHRRFAFYSQIRNDNFPLSVEL